MSGHTPGPWLPTYSELHQLIHGRVTDIYIRGGGEARHNRLLIAASPDLLEALEDLIVRFKNCAIHGGSDEEFVEEALRPHRAAIKKATENE